MVSKLQTWVVLLFLLTLSSASLVDNVIDALEKAVDCGSCHALLVVLQGLAYLGDSAFTDTFATVCKTLKVMDDDVCDGALGQQGPILAHDLRSISALGQTGSKLCDAVFGLCQPPAVNPFTVSFPKAPPSIPKQFVSTGKTPFQVAHFSDAHIDRMYTPGSEVNCTKPICCRNFADQTGPTTVPAGPLGSRNCDTPGGLAQSMLRAISAQNNKFSIYTGDVIEAAIWLVDQKEATSDLQIFNNEMATLLNTPVFPAIGNHDSAPVNSFPRSTSPANVQWVFDLESQGWATWLNSSASSDVKHISGSYSVTVPGTNLRIISINTIYWYKDNFWLYDSDNFQPDPNGILAFTVQQLQVAEDAGQRAWIIAHMPPSGGDAMHDQSNYFSQIVSRYHNTIAAQFYGHTHDDEFVVGYSDYKNQNVNTAVSMGLIAPSLTPRDANSAFKVYDIDPDTYEVMDSRVFSSDIADPNFQIQPSWKLEYSARATYAPAIGGWPATQSLNPAFWHKLTEAFSTNDTAFQLYESFKTRGANAGTCDSTCKSTTICNLRALRAENNCDVSTPGLGFRRRDENAPINVLRHGDHCEGVGLGYILSNAVARISKEDTTILRQRLKEKLGDA